MDWTSNDSRNRRKKELWTATGESSWDLQVLQQVVGAVTSWLGLLEPGKTTTQEFEAFARTIICDQHFEENARPRKKSEFLQTLLGACAMFHEERYPNAEILHPTLKGYQGVYLERERMASTHMILVS